MDLSRGMVSRLSGSASASSRSCPGPGSIWCCITGSSHPKASWRREVVARAEREADAVEPRRLPARAGAEHEDAEQPRARPKYRAWADLMRWTFETDVLCCPRCGRQMTVLATIDDPAVIHRILTHLGLSLDTGDPLPAHADLPSREHSRRISSCDATLGREPRPSHARAAVFTDAVASGSANALPLDAPRSAISAPRGARGLGARSALGRQVNFRG